MKLRLAICDDDHCFNESFKELLTKYQFQANMDIEISEFAAGRDLLAAYDSGISFDIVFMDIELDDSNGIDIAKRIKSMTNAPYLIFVSNYPSYMLESFDAHPYYFINKPLTYERIRHLFDDITADIAKNDLYLTLIHTDNQSEMIDIRDIYSIETIPSRKNYCLLKTQNRSIEFRGTIADLSSKLAGQGFIQCHRGCLVNLRHIHYVDKNRIIMNNASALPASRSGLKLINTNYL